MIYLRNFGGSHSLMYRVLKLQWVLKIILFRMGKQNIVDSYNGIVFSHKKNEKLIFTTIWMNLENVMLSELSQSQNTIY